MNVLSLNKLFSFQLLADSHPQMPNDSSEEIDHEHENEGAAGVELPSKDVSCQADWIQEPKEMKTIGTQTCFKNYRRSKGKCI